MSGKSGSRYVSAAKYFSEIASVVISALGVFVLLGWIFNIPAIKSVLPEFVTMKANTALCFLLIGISLWSSQVRRADNTASRFIARSCALLVASIGALTLYEYLFSINIGIDQLIFKDDPGAFLTTYPGRMALSTAINFTVLGVTLLLLDAKSKRVYYTLQACTLITLAISLLSLAGYIYGVSSFYGRISIYTAMALHTATIFVIAAVAILIARPDKGLAAVLTNAGSAGILIRILLPIAVVVPMALGWLKLYGEKAGMFNNEFGAALMAIGNLTIMAYFIFRSGVLISGIEKSRQISEEKVLQSCREWERTFDSVSDIILILGLDQIIRRANKSFFDIFKMKPEDVIGKKCYDVLHGMDKPWPGCPFDNTMRTASSYTEEVHDPKIGIPLLITTSPVFDNDGKMVEVVHIAKDISAIKNVEKELIRKVDYLEKFQKVTVDRELKMKELKSKISELEARLDTKLP